MKKIIAGHFDQQNQAEMAYRELRLSGFPAPEMTLFYLTPQGQHDMHPLGGDQDESVGAHHAAPGALRGAASGAGAGTLVGVATLPVLGPAGPLVGAAVGAYTGALVGALHRLEDSEPGEGDAANPAEPTSQTPPRKAGFLLAVAVGDANEERDAIDILGRLGAEIDAAEGELKEGEWLDFDPRKPVNPIGARP